MFNILRKITKKIRKKEIIPIIQVKDKEEILKDKVVLITGGSGGIGLAIAKKFVDCKAKVIISGRNEEKLKDCCKKIGSNCKYVTMDLKNIKEIPTKVKEAIEIYGRIDVLVNSAGMHIDKKEFNFFNVLESEYDDVMNLNLKSTYFITQEIAKYMIKNKIKGHVLMISSNRGIEPSWSPYGISKLGINGITKGIAQELIKHDIVVNAIAPGPTATRMQSYEMGESIYTEQNKILRYTMPEEVAEYAVLLVSQLGNTIVGDTIYMSGGRGIIDIR